MTTKGRRGERERGCVYVNGDAETGKLFSMYVSVREGSTVEAGSICVGGVEAGAGRGGAVGVGAVARSGAAREGSVAPTLTGAEQEQEDTQHQPFPTSPSSTTQTLHTPPSLHPAPHLSSRHAPYSVL